MASTRFQQATPTFHASCREQFPDYSLGCGGTPSLPSIPFSFEDQTYRYLKQPHADTTYNRHEMPDGDAASVASMQLQETKSQDNGLNPSTHCNTYPLTSVGSKKKPGVKLDVGWTRKGTKKSSSISSPSSSMPGPIPATKPRVEGQDSQGVPWISFEYSQSRIKTDYRIRCDVKTVDTDQQAHDFKDQNCVYPRAYAAARNQLAYHGNRLAYETECNLVGWALAELNPGLQGKRGLLQRAVDSWRNSSSDRQKRSRRVRRNDKVEAEKLRRRESEHSADTRFEAADSTTKDHTTHGYSMGVGPLLVTSTQDTRYGDDDWVSRHISAPSSAVDPPYQYMDMWMTSPIKDYQARQASLYDDWPVMDETYAMNHGNRRFSQRQAEESQYYASGRLLSDDSYT